jgi:hypothetical protein
MIFTYKQITKIPKTQKLTKSVFGPIQTAVIIAHPKTKNYSTTKIQDPPFAEERRQKRITQC